MQVTLIQKTAINALKKYGYTKIEFKTDTGNVVVSNRHVKPNDPKFIMIHKDGREEDYATRKI